MADQDENNKDKDLVKSEVEGENQSKVDEKIQPEDEKSTNVESTTNEINKNNHPEKIDSSNEKKNENQNLDAQDYSSKSEISQNINRDSRTKISEALNEKKDGGNGNGHEVIHKKMEDYTFMLQDNKGELK